MAALGRANRKSTKFNTMHCGGSPLLRRLGLHSASSVHLDEPLFQLNGGGNALSGVSLLACI